MNNQIAVNIGEQRFDKLIEEHKFYIDKTGFVKEWWEYGSTVTLITRPRRFGKTLNMSMIECFFSNEYKAAATCLRDSPYGMRQDTGRCRERSP